MENALSQVESKLAASSPGVDTAPAAGPALTSAPAGLQHGGSLTVFTKEVAAPLHLGNRTTAAGLVSNYLKIDQPHSDAEANTILTSFLQYLLDGQRYVDAATLLWRPSMFSGEPRAVKLMWDALFQNAATIVPGAASMGKTYAMGVWFMLDWIRDPNFTNVQVVGPSEKHLEKNLFSHLVKLHRSASIPLPGDIRELEITCDPKQKDSGIFGIVVPTGKKAAGRLQGVKVVMRPVIHRQFGPTSRVRFMLEEAENIPVGIWDDVTNIFSNVSGVERFKIACPFNPKDPNSQCAIRCEPLAGWNSVDVETSEEWQSKRGWKVVRLDAYKCENVLQGQEIFYGLQTKPDLDALILNAGGVGTPGYYTMARGWYPPQGVDLAVIPQHLLNDVYGIFEFVDTPHPCAAVDVALEGGDNAICALGRFGLSSGWRKPTPDNKPGPFLAFKNERGESIRKEVLQVDQLFQLPKGDTLKLVAEIRRICGGAYVRGEYLGIDRTGNGAGVHDILVSTFNPGVKGINGSASPTERRILEEDQKLPCDEYAYLLSELWFATRKFIEFGFVKFAPEVPQDPLLKELGGRRFLLSASTVKTKVESKKDYKSRGSPSPDRADALTMLVHVVRLNSSGPPSATHSSSREDERPYEPVIGCTDRREYL